MEMNNLKLYKNELEQFTTILKDWIPKDASIAVHYRDHWFYISKNDLDSKESFSLLAQLVAFQDESGTVAPPTFTIGIGTGAGR